MMLLAAVILWSVPPVRAVDFCGGEYSLCGDGSCALVPSRSCGICKTGQYVCPLSNTCFDSLDEYTKCPGLRGTHFDWSLPENERLDKLAAAVNVSDMILQLVNNAPAIENADIPAYNYLNDNMHAIIGTDDTTVFPMGVGLGASWSTELAREVGRAMASEARATHNVLADKSGNSCGGSSTGQVTSNGCGLTLYGPNINILRDPRWGRAEEVYSEDPHLSSELAVATVTGIQGNKEGSRSGAVGGALIASAGIKHTFVYNAEDRRDSFDVRVSARDLWETYLPIFKAAVVRGKASHVMCSYNAVNGKPTCAHDELLNGILRQQWGFDGFVVSDYDAWANLVDTFHYADNYTDAAAKGINAGMDQEGGFGKYSAVLGMPEALRQGSVTEAAIVRSFRRLMLVRLRLGMFDPPSQVGPMSDEYRPEVQSQTNAKLQLAQRAARESFVLLKNARSALPLNRQEFIGRPHSLALVGPQADDWRLLMGAANYAPEGGPSKGIVTILQGLLNTLGLSAVVSVPGCLNVSCFDADIESVTAATRDATTSVVILGNQFGSRPGWPLCHKSNAIGEDGCESESHDRTRIELPGKQIDVVLAMRKATKGKLVCLLVHGGAVALGAAFDACDGILDLWVPGQMAGAALADILFGDFSPAGRSPITFYQATEDLPSMSDYNEYPHEGSNGTTYRYYVGAPPLFRFGDGLSYTSFRYSNLVYSAKAAPCEPIELSVTVQNIGARMSDEVAQVYASVPNAKVPAPNVRLVAFQRIRDIAPGAAVVVKFSIQPESYAVVYPTESPYHANLMVEAGLLLLDVGGSQRSDYTVQAQVQVSRTESLASCAQPHFVI
jgi:beta-glucosidase